MPKIKPVMAWGLRHIRTGKVMPYGFGNRQHAEGLVDAEPKEIGDCIGALYDGDIKHEVIRVRISVVPKAKRKVKR